MDKAKVAGATANIDEERVGDWIDVVGLAKTGIIPEAERGKERLGNQQDAIENSSSTISSSRSLMERPENACRMRPSPQELSKSG